MKREWDVEALIVHFTLSSAELALLNGKTAYNGLGFAILLKYFAYEGHFPSYKRDIPGALVTFLAEQLAVDKEAFGQYDWKGRTIKDDRAFIRQYFGFREGTDADRAALIAWLLVQPEMQREHREDYWLDKAYHQMREWHIEPLSPDKMARAVRTTLNTYQDSVCTLVYRRLSLPITARLADLLELNSLSLPDSKIGGRAWRN